MLAVTVVFGAQYREERRRDGVAEKDATWSEAEQMGKDG
jgi:hypothetical protein